MVGKGPSLQAVMNPVSPVSPVSKQSLAENKFIQMNTLTK